MSIREDELQRCVDAANFMVSSVHDFEAAAAARDLARMRDIAQRRHDEGIFLKSAIRHHKQLPMGLGSGCTKLENKCRSLCRKFYSEAQSLSSTQRLLRQVQCMCTDMGTEMGLPDTAGCDLASMLPAWMLDDGVQEQEANLAESLGPHAEEFVFPESAVSSGLLHIGSNMTKDVDRSLERWPHFLRASKSCVSSCTTRT